MSPRDLLQLAIKNSGLSETQYAERVLVREPRTVRRWLDGKQPIPPIVVEFLEREHDRPTQLDPNDTIQSVLEAVRGKSER